MEVYRESGMKGKARDLAILLAPSIYFAQNKQTKSTINVVSPIYLLFHILPKCPPILIKRHSLCGDCHQNFSLGTTTFEEHPPLVT